MKILVSCKLCGETLCNVKKPQVSDADLAMYEQSASCDEHGANVYERDEEGLIISTISQNIIAIKVAD